MQDIETEASQVVWQTRFGVCCGGGGHGFWPALSWQVECFYFLGNKMKKSPLRFVTGVESCQALYHWKMPIVIVSRSPVKKPSKFRIPLLSWPGKACVHNWSLSMKCAECFLLVPVSLKWFCSLTFTMPRFHRPPWLWTWACNPREVAKAFAPGGQRQGHLRTGEALHEWLLFVARPPSGFSWVMLEWMWEFYQYDQHYKVNNPTAVG